MLAEPANDGGVMRRQGSGVGQMTKGSSWANAGSEQSVADLLSDPIAQALMWADGVTVKDAIAAIGRLNRKRCREPTLPAVCRSQPSSIASALCLVLENRNDLTPPRS